MMDKVILKQIRIIRLCHKARVPGIFGFKINFTCSHPAAFNNKRVVLQFGDLVTGHRVKRDHDHAAPPAGRCVQTPGPDVGDLEKV